MCETPGVVIVTDTRKFLTFFFVAVIIFGAVYSSVNIVIHRDDHAIKELEKAARQLKLSKLHSYGGNYSGNKIVLIGIDGLSPKIIKRLFDQNRLSNMKALASRGTWGPLKSRIPTASPALWTSILTGVIPSKHGIKTFVKENQAKNVVLPVASTMRKSWAIWDVLKFFDISSAFVSFWGTWPPEEINGWMVSDRANLARQINLKSNLPIGSNWTVQDDGIPVTYPDKLYGELKAFSILPDEIDMEILKPFVNGTDAEKVRFLTDKKSPQSEELRQCWAADQFTRETTTYIMKRYKPVFMGTYLVGVDKVSHLFWNYMEPEYYDYVNPEELRILSNVIERYYDWMDMIVGEIVEAADDNATIILLSDHGLEPSPGDEYSAYAHHNNAPDGVIIAAGPGIAANGFVAKDGNKPVCSLMDTTPTVLAIMGLPASRDFDGNICEAILSMDTLNIPPSVTNYPSRKAKDPSKSKYDKEMLDRMRAVGYIQ